MKHAVDVHYFGTLLVGLLLELAFLGAWWGTNFQNEKLERFVQGGAVAMVAFMRVDPRAAAPASPEAPKQ